MAEKSDDTIEAFLTERRTFVPSGDFRRRANMADPAVYQRAAADPEGFWAGFARELFWFREWKQVLKQNPPFFQWFVGGKTNVSYNCLDRHLERLGDKPALLWEGEPGDTRSFTYRELHREVSRFASALKALGVGKGDRVTLYMPLIPELPIAMLACARIGAIHSVVFSGFSPPALLERLNNAQSRLLITADAGYRRGQLNPLKEAADQVVDACSSLRQVIVVDRTGGGMAPMKPGRDRWWHQVVAEAAPECPALPLDSETTLFILYTSGTTGTPKGVVHTTGGYMVGVYATTRWVLDLKSEDSYWCTADIGWVTGHSYTVYGPLLCGGTTLIYEGAPDYPQPDRVWAIAEKYRVSIFYTAPTFIRAAMGWGEKWLSRHDLSRLRLLGSVGEPINPEVWMWYYQKVGGGRCPIVDTWWQTETGMILISPLPGITPLKPGSATLPFPGIKADVVDEAGNSLPPGKGGYLVIKKPWPAMLRTIYSNPQRYIQGYWSRFPGVYLTGDGARRDEDGYLWVLGRTDDILSVAGHRLSTMELESALVEHPAVAEAAVIGKSHPVKGEVPLPFVVLRSGVDHSSGLAEELKGYIAERIGPIARPEQVVIVGGLPKTRSGKIMRRLLRDIAEGRAMGDITTLEDPNALQELRQRYQEG